MTHAYSVILFILSMALFFFLAFSLINFADYMLQIFSTQQGCVCNSISDIFQISGSKDIHVYKILQAVDNSG
jgi:hypothetical protein